MNFLLKVNLVLLTLLSIATGFGKCFALEADVQIFASIGFGLLATIAVGAIQVIAGLLLHNPATQRYACIALILSFIIATAGLFASEMFTFGYASILFIVMAVFPIIKPIFLIKKS